MSNLKPKTNWTSKQIGTRSSVRKQSYSVSNSNSNSTTMAAEYPNTSLNTPASSNKTVYQASNYRKLVVVCAYQAQKGEILKLFGKYGRIEEIRMTKTSVNNTATIKYYKASEALKSFEELNGYSANGIDKLKISFHGEDLPADPFKIYVRIDKSIKFTELSDIFKKYGKVLNCYIPVNYETNQNKGYGFITFSKASEAARAIEESNKNYSAQCQFGKRHQPFGSNHTNKTPTNPIVASTSSASLQANQENNENFVMLKKIITPTTPIQAVKPLNSALKNVTNTNVNNTNVVLPMQMSISVKRENITPNQSSLPFKKRKIEIKPNRTPVAATGPVSDPITAAVDLNQPNISAAESYQTKYLAVLAKTDEHFLKSLFDAIPGMVEFQKQSEGKYLIEYNNVLFADHAFQKFNKLKLPTNEMILVVKRMDVKKELIKNMNEKQLNQPNVSFAEYFLNVLENQTNTDTISGPLVQLSDPLAQKTQSNVSTRNDTDETKLIYNWLI